MTLSRRLSVIMLNVVMVIDGLSYCYADCHYAERRYAECRGAFSSSISILIKLIIAKGGILFI
jgi:hypothetical protein